MSEKISQHVKLPVIPLRGITVYPNTVFSFDIGRKKSLKGLEKASETDRYVFLVPQKDAETQEPELEDLYTMGVIVEIKQFFRAQVELLRVVAEGVKRGRLLGLEQLEDYWTGEIEELEEDSLTEPDSYEKALIRSAKEHFETLSELSSIITAESLYTVLNENHPGKLADLMMANIHSEFEKKQAVLEELDPLARLNAVITYVLEEIDIMTIQKGIMDKVKQKVEKSQKEYYLKEQLKVIQEELGEDGDVKSEVLAYEEQIRALSLESEDEKKLLKEANRLLKLGSSSPEASVVRTYLDNILELPWKVRTKDTTNLEKAEKVINQNHYGLEKVKERVLEFLAVRMNAEAVDTPILCLVGPPGAGKTSVAESIAEALNRNYVRMSLGGVRDEAEIRGHRRTYIGAMPGRIITGIKQAGSCNPLFLLDEIDKLSSDYRGDPASALLEVLDEAQNHAFRDNYIEVPFNLTDVMFICTANTLSPVPPALLDRLEVIELSGYTEDEKMAICKEHLLPKQLKKHGLNGNQLRIEDKSIQQIINGYTKESGVRQLERLVAKISRKTVKKIVMGERKRITIDPDNLEEFLGIPKFKQDDLFENPEIGAVKGLAWTGYGGDTLSIEVNVMKGSGKFELTGNMGTVMKESAKAAISYIRSRAEELNINEKFYKDTDIHIHIPEGAVPKDGPSAGITMAAAMVSALTKKPAYRDVAMTGEITIRGNILPVGGLKEKILAGKRHGIKTILVPMKNESDISEISADIKDGLDIQYVSTMQEVISKVLISS